MAASFFVGKGGQGMAVTPPTAPTPPTPPSVPRVTLQDGGSVQESTAPPAYQSQTDDEANEAQARQAVADGDGALQKTTRSKPQAKDAQQQKPAQTQAQAGGTSAQSSETGQTLDPQTAALLQQEGQQGQAQQQTQAQQVQPPKPGMYGNGYSAAFWVGSIAVITLLAFVLLRTVLKKNKRKGELGIEDIAGDVTPPSKVYAGMTADEVLRALSAEDQAQEHAAEPAKEKHVAVPDEKTRVVQRPMPEREDGHFEVKV